MLSSIKDFLRPIYRFFRPVLPHFPLPFPILYEAQHHEIETLEYFSQPSRQLLRDIALPFSPPKQVIMCFTNRCGSNWLAELLHATGEVGLADELFNSDRIRETCDEFNLISLDDLIRHFPSHHSTSKGVFATKLSWDQLYFLSRIEVIPRLMPHPYFIYITRRDVAAQALSLLIAQKTGQWKSNWNNGEYGNASLDEITDAQIAEKIVEIQFAQSQFELFFGTFYLKPYRVCYEDVLANPQQTVADILWHLRIFNPLRRRINPAKLTLTPQRNAQSEQRLAVFHQHTEHRYDPITPQLAA